MNLATTQPSARVRGLRQAALGLAIFLPGLLLFALARDWLLATFGTRVGDEIEVRLPRGIALVIGGPMAAGYVLLMMGGYRAIFGARGQAMTAAWSLFRILFGLFATITMIVVLGVLAALLLARSTPTGP